MDCTTLAPPPYPVGPDTFVIPELFPAGPETFVPVNSMVITGPEPIIVDTGTALNEERWLEAVGGIVDFADVRWIYLSHDDHDHVGNLAKVLELSPQATLVTTWFSVERLAGDLRLPMDRMRWVRHGESFVAGDRTLMAKRPPIFDGPTTRGLLDTSTGVYWAADAFASLVPGPVVDVADIPREMWEETFLQLNRLISPWHAYTDPRRYGALVDSVAELEPTVVASAHGVALRDELFAEGLELLRRLPGMDNAVEPGQSDLEAMLRQLVAA